MAVLLLSVLPTRRGDGDRILTCISISAARVTRNPILRVRKRSVSPVLPRKLVRAPQRYVLLSLSYHLPGRVVLVFVGREPAAQTSEQMRFRVRTVPPAVHEIVVQQKSRFFPQQLGTDENIF